MNALVLEDIGKFQVREVQRPIPKPNEVLIRVFAVGICGTDLHIFHGLANYNRDKRGQPIPLKQHHQVLGHEFCGQVEAIGSGVRKCKPGDRVVVDQVLNCISQGRSAICEYCETGDSHQCEFGQELGITGLPGAFAEFVSVPEMNIIALPADMSSIRSALVEPLGCVLHASNRMENAAGRYAFDGRHRIRRILILGAGPSGLLFLQYLRNIIRFDGDIFVADMRDDKLALAMKLGGTPFDVRRIDLIAEIGDRTHGERIEYLIEATGSGAVFDWIPSLIRRQATVLLYGAGHSNRDIGCLTPFQASEINIVTSGGASGGFDPDGTATTYRRSMECIHRGEIDVECLVSYRYTSLAQIPTAFERDVQFNDFIKGVLVLEE
jgi:L-iditol 2-dehydrogenase